MEIKQKEYNELTIVARTTEEEVVSEKVRTSTKVRTFGDEHLLEMRESFDDDARRRSKSDAKDVTIGLRDG